MNPCPNCGIIGANFNCPNHLIYWGINPLPDSIPTPQHGGIQLTHPINTELFAEIGRLNVLLNERDKEIDALKQTSADLCPECGWRFLVPGIGCQGCERARLEVEIERLKGLMPPDERGPGFVGQGSWSVFAEKVVAERDLLSEKLKERDKEIERLRDEIGLLERAAHLLCNVRDNLYVERDALNEILAGLRQKGVIDGLNRPLPLKGHHFQCSHGRDGWSLCTCEELRKADTERMESLANELAEEQEAKPGCPKCGDTGRVTITDGTIATSGWCECSKQFADLVAAGQKLRKEFDQKTAGMRGPPSCSKCGDTGIILAHNARGMRQCDCRKYGSHHPECGRAKPGMRSPCNCLGLYERDARNAADRDRAFDDPMEDDTETCAHGNTECKRCKPTRSLRTPEGKPLLPARDFSQATIEDNRERGLDEDNFQRQSGRTTAMVIQALEFVKSNTIGGVVIDVDCNRMKRHVKDLLKHYADELDVTHRDLPRVFVAGPEERIIGVDIALRLRDNALDIARDTKPARDPRQDLKKGDHVRFEIEGVITERQSAGWIKDENGNDYEPVQYAIACFRHGKIYYTPYLEITKVVDRKDE